MSRIDKDILLEQITSFYLRSTDFNGLPIRNLLAQTDCNREDLTKELSDLIKNEKVSVVFGDIHPNPYIRAFQDEPKQAQVEKLSTTKLDHACIYPAPKYLEKTVDQTQYEGKPYTLGLALGEPQLSFKAFDLSVLEYYRNDPRYYYRNDDVRGSISVHDKYFRTGQMAETDQVVLQTFGFSYDSDLNRAVAVFTRYLADLTPEHQQIWKGKELTGDYALHPDYYRNSILGEWGTKVSIFEAFIEEMKIINRMAEKMGRPPLFRNDFSEGGKPREFGFLVRPTLKEFNSFVLLLDKMISENINRGFFRKEVPYEDEEVRGDGKVVIRNKGTITILKEWINKCYKTDDREPIDDMINTFRAIRRKRQKPAHAIDENVFDQEYFHDQRDLIIQAYEAVQVLRLLLANHPKARGVEVPPFIQEGEIWTY